MLRSWALRAAAAPVGHGRRVGLGYQRRLERPRSGNRHFANARHRKPPRQRSRRDLPTHRVRARAPADSIRRNRRQRTARGAPAAGATALTGACRCARRTPVTGHESRRRAGRALGRAAIRLTDPVWWSPWRSRAPRAGAPCPLCAR